MEVKNYFKEITGFEKPYTFQMELAEKILNGKNVIMQAPTGSGKTWASIIPFLIAREENIKFPKKLIYILPLRTLANSLYTEIRENKYIKKNNIKVTIQTGEQNDDPYFLEGDIIFTTIDQVLSSLLCIPFSVSQRQGNINAGAILTSYLVFDEFHLLDPSTSLSTTFHLLKWFKKITPFCLMTATLSDKLLDKMCRKLRTDRVIVDKEKFEEIQSQKNKKRYIEVVNNPITPNNIIKNHKKLSIVICNTVDKSQELYLQLKKAVEAKEKFNNTQLICVNSRFTSKDRKDIEKRIKEIFKKGSKHNAILVSTQIIEVGIDITCDVMHTEISPINSFLQRIGRCARYEKEIGKVFVYDVSKEDKSKPYAPYKQDLCIATYNELEKISGENLDYFKSQELIDEILTDIDLKIITGISESERLNEIKNCWINPKKQDAKKLIREIDTVSVIACNDKNKIKNPYLVDKISISRYSLKSKLSKIQKEYEEDWLIGIVQEDNMFFDFSDESKFIVTEISRDDERLLYENLIVLNSKYVSYSKEIGLNFINIGDEKIEIIDKNKEEIEIKMKKETYQQHIKRMILAYKDLLLNRFDYTFDKLTLMNSVNIDELIKFMIVLHDYGKLNDKWQKFARDWQKNLGDDCEGQLLAHTDQSEKVVTNKKPPHHSGAGAVVANKLLFNALGNSDDIYKISIPITSAILKHHGTTVHKSNSYIIEKKGKEEVLKLLKQYCNNISSKVNPKEECLNKCEARDLEIDGQICDFNDRQITGLYFILVRMLRICDQKSFDYSNFDL